MTSELKEIFTHYARHPDYFGMKITHARQKGHGDDGLIHIVTRLANLAQMRVLLDNGADVNDVGDLGYTPLCTMRFPEAILRWRYCFWITAHVWISGTIWTERRWTRLMKAEDMVALLESRA